MKELLQIQSKIHAPKSETNQYGKYKYRKAEQIMEAAKPLLEAAKCTLVVSDEIVAVGNWIYVKATAKVTNEKGETEQAVGWAREAETLAGMSAGQVTGATSSYARKYALCGLFAIDDSKDLDDPSITHPQVATLAQAVAEMKACKSVEELNAVWERYPQFHTKACDFYNITAEVNQKLRK